MKKFLSYLRYSGLSVIITVNPFHWVFFPRIQRGSLEVWDTADSLAVSFLFLTVRFWLDDGSW
jgi:hypothetical protein